MHIADNKQLTVYKVEKKYYFSNKRNNDKKTED